MSDYSPATRAALAVFVLATVMILAATALIVSGRTETTETMEKQRLIEISASVAALVDSQDGRQRAGTDGRLARIAEENDLAGLAILHRRGEILAANGPTELRQIDWSAVVAETANFEAVQTASWDGKDYYMVLHPVTSGERVAVLRSADDIHAGARKGVGGIILLAVLVWLLTGVSLALVSVYAGSRTVERMEVLANRLAGLDRFDENTARSWVNMARPHLGPFARPVDVMVCALKDNNTRHAEARSQIAALFQINPHYVLLCTLDGHIVDANPAFYAMTGLPFEAVRGQRIEALNEVMPIEPLFDLARRSLQEGTSMSGIEYALVNRDDVRRAVQISLRAVAVDEKPAVLIQATDVANQRNLERQISTFSDALDLMVDQRVAQLMASNTSTNRLLDDVGVILASFDAGGSTRRWNRTAQDITGRTVQQVPHFTAFVSVLGLGVEEKQSFIDWFWGPSEGTYPMDVHSATVPVRRVLWRRSTGTDDGLAESRVLLGMDFSRPMPHAGDGLVGHAPVATVIDSTT